MEYLSPEEAGQLANRSTATVYYWIQAGKLRAIKDIGVWKIEKDYFLNWLKENIKIKNPEA